MLANFQQQKSLKIRVEILIAKVLSKNWNRDVVKGLSKERRKKLSCHNLFTHLGEKGTKYGNTIKVLSDLSCKVLDWIQFCIWD